MIKTHIKTTVHLVDATSTRYPPMSSIGVCRYSVVLVVVFESIVHRSRPDSLQTGRPATKTIAWLWWRVYIMNGLRWIESYESKVYNSLPTGTAQKRLACLRIPSYRYAPTDIVLQISSLPVIHCALHFTEFSAQRDRPTGIPICKLYVF